MQHAQPAQLPLVLHVLHRFDTGGLENGVVNLINRLPQYRHAVVAIDCCVPAFTQRVTRPGTLFFDLNKPPGQTLRVGPAFWRLLQNLRPDVVHTRNLAALELQWVAALAGVPLRVHSEHGRDADDVDGNSRRHQLLRRFVAPWVHRFVALSGELEDYLVRKVGIRADRVRRICNGVDIERFTPVEQSPVPADSPFNDPSLFVVGWVGRMQPVKGPELLVDAFVKAIRQAPSAATRLRLVMIGDGPLRAVCQQRLASEGLAELAWLPGERRDIPQLLQSLDAFVLSSRMEGISNTILEAMATGLPVLATRVGGNSELVAQGLSGELLAVDDSDAMAIALLRWAEDPQRMAAYRREALSRVRTSFSLPTMLAAYEAVYRR